MASFSNNSTPRHRASPILETIRSWAFFHNGKALAKIFSPSGVREIVRWRLSCPLLDLIKWRLKSGFKLRVKVVRSMTRASAMIVRLAGPSVATAAKRENWVPFKRHGLSTSSYIFVTALAAPRRFRHAQSCVSANRSDEAILGIPDIIRVIATTGDHTPGLLRKPEYPVHIFRRHLGRRFRRQSAQSLSYLANPFLIIIQILLVPPLVTRMKPPGRALTISLM